MVDVRGYGCGGPADRVFDGGFSERAGGAGQSGQVAAERVNNGDLFIDTVILHIARPASTLPRVPGRAGGGSVRRRVRDHKF
jgi:hypothetical protein